MCDDGTCRPCRLEDRLTDRAMGVAREYKDLVILPTREENYANLGNVIGNQLNSSTRKSKAPSETRTERLRRRRVENRAERVEIDGRLVHPRAKHGTDHGYFYYGCRCEPCTERHRHHKRKAKERERATASGS